jgi:hypothetical protein
MVPGASHPFLLRSRPSEELAAVAGVDGRECQVEISDLYEMGFVRYRITCISYDTGSLAKNNPFGDETGSGQFTFNENGRVEPLLVRTPEDPVCEPYDYCASMARWLIQEVRDSVVLQRTWVYSDRVSKDGLYLGLLAIVCYGRLIFAWLLAEVRRCLAGSAYERRCAVLSSFQVLPPAMVVASAVGSLLRGAAPPERGSPCEAPPIEWARSGTRRSVVSIVRCERSRDHAVHGDDC